MKDLELKLSVARNDVLSGKLCKDEYNNYGYAFIKMGNFLYEGYNELLSEVDREISESKTVSQKEQLMQQYALICADIVSTYGMIRNDVNNHMSDISFFSDHLSPDVFKDAAKDLCSVELKQDGMAVYYEFIAQQIDEVIASAQLELEHIAQYPFFRINTISKQILPAWTLRRSTKCTVSYRDCWIPYTGTLVVKTSEKTKEATPNALVDIIAYLSGTPAFLATDNKRFNNQLVQMYESFDIIDMLRIRHPDYFSGEYKEKSMSLQLPIFHSVGRDERVIIPDTKHERVFQLYHASLKQFEPLPRCVFLYRVCEYGAQVHYCKLMKPEKFEAQDAIEYYVSKILTHDYIPLFYIIRNYPQHDANNHVYYKSSDNFNDVECKDFIEDLKKEVLLIVEEWKRRKYVKDKTLGKIIYNYGRCAAAHGSAGEGSGRYDYDRNYKFMNEVNIILELIARYIIEELNPQLRDLVRNNRDEYISLELEG